jgi:hypothetical protein
MHVLNAIPLLAKLIPKAKYSTVTFTEFERDFLEGLCRIGASGKLLELTPAQESTLVGIYFKVILLPKIKTETYDARHPRKPKPSKPGTVVDPE